MFWKLAGKNIPLENCFIKTRMNNINLSLNHEISSDLNQVSFNETVRIANSLQWSYSFLEAISGRSCHDFSSL
jgi:hypothetical protein